MCVALVFLFPVASFSQARADREAPANGQARAAQTPDATPDNFDYSKNLVVGDFNIAGLKRTKMKYMQHILSQYKGRAASKETLREIETTLQEANIFNEITVTFEEAGAGTAQPQTDGQDAPSSQTPQGTVAVNISLKEKWTVLPLPAFAYTDGTFMGGLFVLDMNAFGVNDNFVLGGMYGPNMKMAVTSYSRRPKKKGELGFSTSFSAIDRNYDFANSDGDTMMYYNAMNFALSANLLFKPTAATSLAFGAGYDLFYPLRTDEVFAVNGWRTGATFEIAYPSWNGVFLSTNSFAVNTTLYVTDSERYRLGNSVAIEVVVQLPVAKKIRIIGQVQGLYACNLNYGMYKNRGGAGVSVWHKNFRTSKFLTGSAGVEFSVLKFRRFGMFSIYTIYQAALAEDFDKTLDFSHGPEAGVRVYFSKLAFSAFSIGGSYNVAKNTWQYSLFLGMSYGN